ncbi:hypothetical protein COO60DRAFT_1464000 [Scenedesmus sp. NREL 46B-D3]|nr:hypothetical protein COO60DRAFT_1464000 [Scenedesmus sp. NREL 46B-D3]
MLEQCIIIVLIVGSPFFQVPAGRSGARVLLGGSFIIIKQSTQQALLFTKIVHCMMGHSRAAAVHARAFGSLGLLTLILTPASPPSHCLLKCLPAFVACPCSRPPWLVWIWAYCIRCPRSAGQPRRLTTPKGLTLGEEGLDTFGFYCSMAWIWEVDYSGQLERASGPHETNLLKCRIRAEQRKQQAALAVEGKAARWSSCTCKVVSCHALCHTRCSRSSGARHFNWASLWMSQAAYQLQPAGCTYLRYPPGIDSLDFLVPQPLLRSAFGDAWQQRGFRVQLSLHKDGACIAGGPGARINAAISRHGCSYRMVIPKAFTLQLSGCRLAVIKAAPRPPRCMQGSFTVRQQVEATLSPPLAALAVLPPPQIDQKTIVKAATGQATTAGGTIRVDGMAYKITISSRAHTHSCIAVPGCLVAQSFPALLQQPRQQCQAVQVGIIVDEPGGLPAAGALELSAATISRSYMALTVFSWMHRPAATQNTGMLYFAVPPSLLRSAFGDAWQQRGFRVQLAVHKDGACVAGTPELSAATISKHTCTHGADYFTLEGAYPIWRSHVGHTLTAICAHTTCHYLVPMQPASCAYLRYHTANDSLNFSVPQPLLCSAFGDAWQQRGFRVQLSVHKDGACIAGGPGARINAAVISQQRSHAMNVTKALTPQLSGCRLAVIKAAPPGFMQACKIPPGVQSSSQLSKHYCVSVPVCFVEQSFPTLLRQPQQQCQAVQLGIIVDEPGNPPAAAFGDNWQQHGFRVQLAVFKDGECIAGQLRLRVHGAVRACALPHLRAVCIGALSSDCMVY